MGKLVIEKWQCDRCGAVHDERPKLPESITVKAIEYLEWAGGPVIDWQEMCKPCNGAVRVAIDAMKADAVKAKEQAHG